MVANLTQPIYNKEAIPEGETIMLLPNDFAQYDELWTHIRVQGTTGSPTSGSLSAVWQTEHPQDSGDYTDLNPTYLDLDVSKNAHVLHGGIGFPRFLTTEVPPTFSPYVEYIRGVKILTPRMRLKFIADFVGGTNPAYLVSVAYHLRKSSSESKIINVKQKPGHQSTVITDTNNYDAIIDVSDIVQKNVIIENKLDQPINVTFYAESGVYSFVNMGVVRDISSACIVTEKDIIGLNGPLQKLRIRINAATAPTKGVVNTWVEGL